MQFLVPALIVGSVYALTYIATLVLDKYDTCVRQAKMDNYRKDFKRGKRKNL